MIAAATSTMSRSPAREPPTAAAMTVAEGPEGAALSSAEAFPGLDCLGADVALPDELAAVVVVPAVVETPEAAGVDPNDVIVDEDVFVPAVVETPVVMVEVDVGCAITPVAFDEVAADVVVVLMIELTVEEEEVVLEPVAVPEFAMTYGGKDRPATVTRCT